MPLSDRLQEGDVFAGYTIVRLLGSGGMGQVYLAQHPRLPRRDALKVLPADLTADTEYRERFHREADLAAELWHPNIVGIHDRGEFEGQLWISMDYVEGTDAAELLRNQYPSGMPSPEAFEIVTAVADALDYAHSRGLLHRDVKPSNILLGEPTTRKRRILLADFGIARQVGDISGLTATNMMVGTPAYCAPEQLTGSDLDGRADQYALGCTAFHLLTGSEPYQHSNPAVVITQHLSAPPPPIGDRRPELAELNDVIAKALAKNRDDRYPSCSDFAAALTGQTTSDATQLAATVLAPGATVSASQQTVAAPAKTRRVLRPAALVGAVAAVVLIAVGAIVGVRLLSRPENHGTPSASQSAPTAANSPPPAGAPPGNSGPAQAAASIKLTPYLTDQAGVLGAPGRTAVENALAKLYSDRNVHLWVVYVNNFSGMTPFGWAEEAMRANGFTSSDALLAVATEGPSFAFRVPPAVAGPIAVEGIRRNQIAPAVGRSEWAHAAVAAANGLDSAAG
ncbi:MAG TPA: serine/threonine-protein kinase [Mycobacterium sp.]|uniref:serine/threonine-protein kinase n=1 Tax=Mycobacterium sp. TaxID=1785 RepID=UPI002D24039D|nr:serine/threonine-protein kinase [Mycobacterium sp.]HZU49021.1 serine/threonine-protein kinase [Mycobacterium sp.]